ncbi:MAG: D-alanine--D-alanine ligase [Chloroflexota bacterium]|nr:D-alanine--D-alanine ligase [Chloroflexota bacterium]
MTSDDTGARRIRIGLLFGGRSAEHDVSLRSALTIIDALDPEKFDILPIGITRSGQWLSGGDPMRALTSASPMFHVGSGEESSDETLDASATSALVSQAGSSASMSVPNGITESVDIVFPALHGPMGEDGTVQGMLELAGVPYVGSGVLGSAVAMDKAVTKTVLEQAGLPQVPWRLVIRKDWRRDPAGTRDWIATSIGFPCFVKPANMGSSVGISKVHGIDEFDTAMELATFHDRRIVIEQGVPAREIEIAVLGNDEPIASVAGEVRPRGEYYDYNAKYVDDTAELIIPAPVDADLLGYLQGLAVDAFKALDLAGLARVDFFIERNTDRVFINEINTLPGFTSISMYPMLWEASGVPIGELIDRLIQLALERHAERC